MASKWCEYDAFYYETNCNRLKDQYINGTSAFCGGSGKTDTPVIVP